MAKEIEIKIQITAEQLNNLQKWPDKNADYKGETHHTEIYLDNPKNSFCFDRNGVKDASDYLRVRFTEKEDTICLKNWYEDPENPGYHSHCDEYETQVGDGKTMLSLLKSLGYTDETVIDKTRKKYMSGDLEVVIDNVKDLGFFVEIELKAKIEDVKRAYKMIEDFLRKAGITKFKKQSRGYVSMLWNPDVDFGEESCLGMDGVG